MKISHFFFLFFLICIASLYASDKQREAAEKEGYDFKQIMESGMPMDRINAILKQHPEILTSDTVNAQNKEGNTLAHEVIHYLYAEHEKSNNWKPPVRLRRLIELKANINIRNNQDLTPLEMVLMYNPLKLGVIQKLVESKAEIIPEKISHSLNGTMRLPIQRQEIEVVLEPYLEFHRKIQQEEKQEASEQKSSTSSISHKHANPSSGKKKDDCLIS